MYFHLPRKDKKHSKRLPLPPVAGRVLCLLLGSPVHFVSPRGVSHRCPLSHGRWLRELLPCFSRLKKRLFNSFFVVFFTAQRKILYKQVPSVSPSTTGASRHDGFAGLWGTARTALHPGSPCWLHPPWWALPTFSPTPPPFNKGSNFPGYIK